MTAAVLGLIAAIAAAPISRSVMTGNHRQSWINGLRDELAIFFAGVATREEGQEIASEISVAYRKLLMRLNQTEPLHRELEEKLRSLVLVEKGSSSIDVDAAITVART